MNLYCILSFGLIEVLNKLRIAVYGTGTTFNLTSCKNVRYSCSGERLNESNSLIHLPKFQRRIALEFLKLFIKKRQAFIAAIIGDFSDLIIGFN